MSKKRPTREVLDLAKEGKGFPVGSNPEATFALTVEYEPEPRRFMPRDCTQCLTRRKPGESYVRVYSKHGKIRYCRCSLCGNTWAQEGE